MIYTSYNLDVMDRSLQVWMRSKFSQDSVFNLEADIVDAYHDMLGSNSENKAKWYHLTTDADYDRLIKELNASQGFDAVNSKPGKLYYNLRNEGFPGIAIGVDKEDLRNSGASFRQFRTSVVAALNELRVNAPIFGAELIRQFGRNASHPYIAIFQSSRNTCFGTEASQFSEILWDPTRTESQPIFERSPIAGNEVRPVSVGLAHEMIHALHYVWHRNLGGAGEEQQTVGLIWKSQKFEGGRISSSVSDYREPEYDVRTPMRKKFTGHDLHQLPKGAGYSWMPVITENRIRAEYGIPMRRYYSGITSMREWNATVSADGTNFTAVKAAWEYAPGVGRGKPFLKRG